MYLKRINLKQSNNQQRSLVGMSRVNQNETSGLLLIINTILIKVLLTSTDMLYTINNIINNVGGNWK